MVRTDGDNRTPRNSDPVRLDAIHSWEYDTVGSHNDVGNEEQKCSTEKTNHFDSWGEELLDEQSDVFMCIKLYPGTRP